MEKQMQDNEPQLILSLKNGSYKAFERIYQMYAKRLFAYSLQFTKSQEESEEIVQDVFMRLWTNRAKIRQEDTLRSLLFIMTKHYLINAFRTKINQPEYEEYIQYVNEHSVDDASYQLEYQEFVAKFRAILKTLPETQQKVITLSKIEQFSNKEIADKLSLSEQTVKNQLSLGLKSLKEKLGSLGIYLVLLFIN
ncbi:RNA polymerase sigma-70 factor [Parabacteroides sp. W1-Q-101]|uniref:RNA polymerase sigma-70 factor n=2 Tax=Tannerellaceae TaxID=2005525 RepID=A0ABR7DZC3_9BACT|nr:MULTISPECIES: RNA polymerase sigma-70 factor [Parabacteroides]MBC5642854.1 RNA polymerase sigma-70 factor [Parabacteroides segnis]MCM0713882.1 RNA polymerase sigma-70 factor [Parabacteroides sp. TA-V-105]MCM0717594.1 RNA polymerase sigma-70 factor [Parabacteroides sp. W1-Q-101]